MKNKHEHDIKQTNFFTKFIKWHLHKKNIYKILFEKECEVRVVLKT